MRWIIALAMMVLAATPALAEPRIALVIGNSSYSGGAFGPLKNPVNDARLMEKTLKGLGFEVEILLNASKPQMEQAMKGLGQRLNAAGENAVGLFYFAGHGVQSDGRNYLIPSDARVKTEQDVWADAPRLNLVEQYMGYAGNDVNIIIIDACRTNDLPSTTRSNGGGLVSEGRSEGVLIAYSAQPGATASDGGANNSPYTTALASLIASESLPVELLFKRVGDSVRSATAKAQQPWYESGLTGADFCFVSCGGKPVAASMITASAPVPAKPDCAAIAMGYAIYFAQDQTTLTPEAKKLLDTALREAKVAGCVLAAVKVDGHDDASGSAEYAQAVGQRRANSVADYLVGAGMPRELMDIRSFGERQLAVATPDGVREPLNRRVYLEIRQRAP